MSITEEKRPKSPLEILIDFVGDGDKAYEILRAINDAGWQVIYVGVPHGGT